ncbi:MAG: hypothetical protein AB1384_10325 [Actinomycetota bacterium]
MAEHMLCPECGVPGDFNREHAWLDNGDLVQSRDHGHRLTFFESDNLDPLFAGISYIIGMSIEPIIIETVRRNLRPYLKRFVTDDVRERIRAKKLDPMDIDRGFMSLANQNGYGRYEVVESRFEDDPDDYFTVSITEPFSLPICAGTHCGAMEAILGHDHAVTYTKSGPQTYNIVAYPYQQPRAFVGRLPAIRYEPAAGDLVLERCPSCGCPRALSECEWHLERGVVMNRRLGRRMAMIGQMELDPIFVELENELGDTIPQTVVEAQRRFSKTGFYSIRDIKDAGRFRTALAMRGLGNLRELKINRRGLHMLVENAALPLMVVGMMQGIFEMAFDLDTDVEWEMSRGSLRMELIPRTVAISA